MARDDDGNGVGSDGTPNGTTCGCAPGAVADVAVRHDVAEWDLGECRPHRLLELGSLERRGDCEPSSCAREILRELCPRLLKHGRGLFWFAVVREGIVAGDVEPDYGRATSSDLESAEGAFHADEGVKRCHGTTLQGCR